MAFANWIGKKRLWTAQHVMAGLIQIITEISGPLPVSDVEYYRMKKGNLQWPPVSRIREFHHSLSRAWLAAGAASERVTLTFCAWTHEENEYLLEHAGNYSLDHIAKKLHRSQPAVRARLGKKYKITARSNQGYLSASELSQEFKCSYRRVRNALSSGEIKGRYDKLRNRWEVDLGDLTDENKAMLRTLKNTHKNSRTDLGDYEKRYGIHRQLINGKVVRVHNMHEANLCAP